MTSKQFHKILSKRLSYVLRHDPASIQLQLSIDGYASLSELERCLNEHGEFQCSESDIRTAVANGEKQRFLIKDDISGGRIRACQGHTIPVDLDLNEAEPPSLLYHGTVATSLISILNVGIQKQKRHHVHLSETQKVAEEVGRRRKGDLVLLTIDADTMYTDGNIFYLSDNNVWLTDHVLPCYFKMIQYL